MNLIRILACCSLLGCVIDQDLGDHRPEVPLIERVDAAQPPAQPDAAEQLEAGPNDAGTDAAQEDGAETEALPDASGAPDAAQTELLDAAEAEALDAGGSAVHDAMTGEEPSPDATVGEGPVDAGMDGGPMELPAVCHLETDNLCLVCQGESCCEARVACTEVDGCHCHLECEQTEEPEACHETCGPNEAYQALQECARERCAECI